jgi:hypothetical protein
MVADVIDSMGFGGRERGGGEGASGWDGVVGRESRRASEKTVRGVSSHDLGVLLILQLPSNNIGRFQT